MLLSEQSSVYFHLNVVEASFEVNWLIRSLYLAADTAAVITAHFSCALTKTRRQEAKWWKAGRTWWHPGTGRAWQHKRRGYYLPSLPSLHPQPRLGPSFPVAWPAEQSGQSALPASPLVNCSFSVPRVQPTALLKWCHICSCGSQTVPRHKHTAEVAVTRAGDNESGSVTPTFSDDLCTSDRKTDCCFFLLHCSDAGTLSVVSASGGF